MLQLVYIQLIMRFVFVLLPFLGAACHTGHIITLRPDRSVVMRNSTTCAGLDVSEHYGSPAVQLIDTNSFGLVQSIMVISDIDSLGNHLPTFSKGQFNFSLQGNELTIRVAQAPLKKCWSVSGLTLFVEQGIQSVSGNKHFKVHDHYAFLRIRRKKLRKNPEELGAVFMLRPRK